jgi:hypothetical protein
LDFFRLSATFATQKHTSMNSYGFDRYTRTPPNATLLSNKERIEEEKEK